MCRVQHLNSKDSSCYLNEIEPVGLRKCPYGHLFANREYLRSVTVTYIYRSFTYNVASKTCWHTHGTKLRHCHPVYTLPFSIQQTIHSVLVIEICSCNSVVPSTARNVPSCLVLNILFIYVKTCRLICIFICTFLVVFCRSNC